MVIILVGDGIIVTRALQKNGNKVFLIVITFQYSMFFAIDMLFFSALQYR